MTISRVTKITDEITRNYKRLERQAAIDPYEFVKADPAVIAQRLDRYQRSTARWTDNALAVAIAAFADVKTHSNI